MAINKIAVPMREQPASERRMNFQEVPYGYSAEEAIEEANRCIQCKNRPCVSGCPVNISIPEFIKALREGEYQKSIDIIHETDSLPCVTGRVCPQEEQCQALCVLGKKGEPISIGRLERFVADWDMKIQQETLSKGSIESKKNTGKRVAVVGSGPAGLTCAADCAKLGYDVVVFEGFHELGGVLVYGIPEFRLPKAIVASEIELLKKLGVTFVKNVLIGRALTIDDLFKNGFEAIFIGTGAGLPNFMKIPGENLNGVYSANEFLTRVNLMKAYLPDEYDTPVHRGKKVAVIGGGNVAMDSARTAIRLGADEVYLVYRRTETEMPARIEETHHAHEEGVIFKTLSAPVKYFGDDKGFVKSMECIEMELGEPDASGRRRPIEKKGSNFTMDIDQVIVAVGTTPNPLISKTTPELNVKKYGEIIADEYGQTSIKGVFAGGDIVTGAATVVTAMGAGRKAAEGIDQYIKNKK